MPANEFSTSLRGHFHAPNSLTSFTNSLDLVNEFWDEIPHKTPRNNLVSTSSATSTLPETAPLTTPRTLWGSLGSSTASDTPRHPAASR